MKSMMLGMLAETCIHPGSGQTTGFVDLPVARESTTAYPVIVGSGIKGALRDFSRDINKEEEYKHLWGNEEKEKTDFGAGQILVSDARLLLLPVRSLTSHFKWVTCPYLLQRFQRDCLRGNIKINGTNPDFNSVSTCKSEYLGAKDNENQTALFLEEREFVWKSGLPDELVKFLEPLIFHTCVKNRLASQLVVIDDKEFTWFAQFGLSVNARNKLHHENKTSKNLWYEETIPPESLFYCMLTERNADSLIDAQKMLKERNYLQAGGNETIGQGWFAIQCINGEES
jgi:CRISPR-associated protein Cmr4